VPRPCAFFLAQGREALTLSSVLAILLDPLPLGPAMQIGTLAVRGLYDSQAKPLHSNVGWADWSPDGTQLVYTVFPKNRACSIEIYTLEHETHRIHPVSGAAPYEWYSHVRFSPDGKLVAFLQHEGTGSAGHVVILNLATGATQTSPSYPEISGLAWSPAGKEVWYSAAEKGHVRGLYALGRSRAARLVYQAAVALSLQDISKSGDVLVMREFDKSAVFIKNTETQGSYLELSWFDWSTLGDISADGKEIALVESGEAVGNSSVFLRKVSGGDATLLGEARGPISISPDGDSVLALTNESCKRAVLLSPKRQSEVLTKANLCVNSASWLPDGRRFILDASEPNHKHRCYVQAMDGTLPRPFTAEDSTCALISPDGNHVLVENSSNYYKVAIDGKEPPVKVKLDLAYTPIRWWDGNQILADDGKMHGISLVDLASGQVGAVQPIKFPSEVESLSFIKVSANRQTIAYSGYKLMSDLYLIHGLR